jgi:hypothetical protein
MRRCVALLPAVLAVWSFLPVSVLGAGTKNFEFLRVPVAARQGAVGGALTALSDDVGALSWNPAGLSRVESSQALAAYMNFPEGVQAGLVAVGGRLQNGWDLAVALKYLSYGSMTLTTPADPTGQRSDTFGASDIGLTVAGAYPLTSGLRVGIGTTYISGSIESYNASAVGLDAGLLLDLPAEGLCLGASLKSLEIVGSSFYEEDISLPTEGRIGIGFASPGRSVQWGLDVAYTSGRGLSLATGGEILLGRTMWVRAGMNEERWNMGRESDTWGSLSAFSWGIGLFWDEWHVDYGISPFGQFGTIHRLSLMSEI